MNTKATLAALLLAAATVTPSYGGDKFWWENDQEFTQRVSQAKVSQEKTIAPTPYFRISHDDFEGEDVFTTTLYPEDKDGIYGYELVISNTDPTKISKPTHLYLVLKERYIAHGRWAGSGQGKVYLQGPTRWFTPNDFRFKTDVINTPRDLPNATWVTTEDVTDLLKGKELVVRIKTGDKMIEKSFSLENEAVSQTLAMLGESK